MTGSGSDLKDRRASWRERLTAIAYRDRTEANTPARQALAVGLGLYIGASPFIGFHLLLSLGLGWIFGLNRFKVYLAANISNPLVAPLLYATEYFIGARLRGHGTGAPQSVQWHGIALDLLVGSVVLGLILGILGATLTFWTLTRRNTDPDVSALVDATAERYLRSGIGTWELARGKIRLDPVYVTVLERGLLPASGVLIDLGCGPGYMLALLATARDRFRAGRWPHGWPAPPLDLHLRGIELRPRILRRAATALEGDAVLECLDLSVNPVPPCRAALLFDVLHLLPHAAQQRLLSELAAQIDSGGVIAIREADADGGWPFKMVRAGNRVNAILHGTPGRPFAFDTVTGWSRRLERAGFDVESIDRHDGVFANVLIFARRRPNLTGA